MKRRSKKCKGVRTSRKDEEMDWAPPREKLERPKWEEAATVVERVEAVVSDAVEGTFVDLDGESRHEQVEAKLSRR